MTTPFEALVSTLLYRGYEPIPRAPSAPDESTPLPYGILYPPAYARRDSRMFDHLQMECVLRGTRDTVVGGSVRFLQAGGRPQQARERRVRLPRCTPAALARAPAESTFAFAAAGPGKVSGRAILSARRVGRRLWLVRLRVENTSPLEEAPCDEERHADALAESLLSTHAILRAENGTFVSPLERDGPLSSAVRACENVNTWPVLASSDDRTVLGAAVVLADHPSVSVDTAPPPADEPAWDAGLLVHMQQLTADERHAIAEQDPELKQLVERAVHWLPDELH